MTRAEYRKQLFQSATLAAMSPTWSKHDAKLNELFDRHPDWYAEDYRELEQGIRRQSR